MYNFIVNGTSYSETEDKNLMTYLRENLGLKSVKDGCGEKICGTCTIIIDDRAIKACAFSLSKIDGKTITTVEGISQREKDVFTYCFKECGAVQCGFCIPGVVIAAKALILNNQNPTREEAAKAIRTNLCRCTGYIKIIDAILLAAKFFREDIHIINNDEYGINNNVLRLDAEEKVLATGKFADDIEFPNMAHGKAVRTIYPRARVIKVDSSKAENDPRCLAVITSKDVKNNLCGHLDKDWPVFIAPGDITRTIGDAICLVVATKAEYLEELCSLVEVEYEELEGVYSIESAMQDNIIVHPGKTTNLYSQESIIRGNAEEAIKNSDYSVSYTYTTPQTEHAFMERECAVSLIENDQLVVYTSSQSVYKDKEEIAHILGLEENKVRCIASLVGGGFGGKEDLTTSHFAAIATYKLKIPVKVKLTRNESLMIHPKRHAMKIDMTLACDSQGYLKGFKANILSDAGSYASLSGPVLQRACTHAAGPYNYGNISINGKAYYTNNIPSGAFRGFGVPQSNFAVETAIDKLCELVNIDPFEFRYKNAIKPGDVLPNGQIASVSTAMKECLESVKEDYYSNPKAGIACAMKNTGIGVGIPDWGRARIIVKDEKVHLYTAAACMGQGLVTVMAQIISETTKLPISAIVTNRPDTNTSPDSGSSTASRQTAFTGEAVKIASFKLKDALENKSLKELEGEEFIGNFLFSSDPIDSKKENPVSHLAYSYSAQVAHLDEKGKVEKITAAIDGGKIINPKSAEGQIEGGVLMGMGYALTENFITENGYLKTKFATLGLLRSTDAPIIDVRFVNAELEDTAYGAKGIGELCTIPTASAIANAYYKKDGLFRTSLPLEKTAYRR